MLVNMQVSANYRAAPTRFTRPCRGWAKPEELTT
jgi:hypothetical protein